MTGGSPPATGGGGGAPALLAVLAVAALLAEVEMQLLVQVASAQSVPEVAEKLYNVTVGRPDWREWQSRLLVPWLFRWAGEAAGGGIERVYLPGLHLLHLAKNALFGLLALRLAGERGTAAKYLLFFSFATVALYDPLHRYPWDYLDMMAVTALLYGIFRRKGDLYFALLFLLALLNRESALLVPAWMLLDAAAPGEGGGGGAPRARRRRAAVALALAAAGAAATAYLRSRFLVEEMAPHLFADPDDFRPPLLLRNARYVAENWLDLPPGLGGVRVLLVLAFPAALAAAWRVLDPLARRVALLALAVWLFLAVAGSLGEMRIYSMLVPFGVLLPLYHWHLRPAPAAGPSPAAPRGEEGAP